jgi:hypothetical protein
MKKAQEKSESKEKKRPMKKVTPREKKSMIRKGSREKKKNYRASKLTPGICGLTPFLHCR